MMFRAAAALLLAASSTASAAPRGCRGSLSGAVAGGFACTASIVERDGTFVFSLDGLKPIDGVPGYSPGAFELPGPPEARTYTLETLGMGRASVAAEGGAFYSATKTSGQRGEVTLTLTSVKRSGKAPGGFAVHGRYRARLLPAGGGKTGEVVVEARF